MRNLAAASDPAPRPARLPYRALPGLRTEVPVVGAGCWPLGGPCTNGRVDMGWAPVNDPTAVTALRAAYQAGVRLFDTADVYGHGLSERRLGRLLREIPRHEVIVASKVGYTAGPDTHPYAPEQMRSQFLGTLDRLGTTYLDVYAFHSGDFGPDDLHLGTAASVMGELVELGLVRAVGMRAPHTFAAEWADEPDTSRGRRARRFLDLFDRLRPDVISVRHNLLSPTYRPGETDIFAFARHHRVGVLVKQLLGQGLLTGRHHPTDQCTFGPGDHRAGKPWFTPAGLRLIHEGLQPLRHRFGDSPVDLVRVAIRYALDTAPDAVALVGFRTADQVTAATTGLDDRLTEPEITFIRDTGQQLRARLDAQLKEMP